MNNKSTFDQAAATAATAAQLDALEERKNEDDGSAHPGPSEGFAIPIVLALIGFYLLYGLLTMQVPESAAWPGPRMFPTFVTVLLFVVALSMGIKAGVQRRKHRAVAGSARSLGLDWSAVGIITGTFLVFALTLVPLGWILSGALLFWGVAIGLGSRTWLKDALLSLGVSSLVQVGFSAGLGLNLPSGLLGLI